MKHKKFASLLEKFSLSYEHTLDTRMVVNKQGQQIKAPSHTVASRL